MNPGQTLTRVRKCAGNLRHVITRVRKCAGNLRHVITRVRKCAGKLRDVITRVRKCARNLRHVITRVRKRADNLRHVIQCSDRGKPLQPHVDALGAEVLFEFGDGNFAEMEDAGSKGSIRMTLDKGIAEMFLTTGTAAGDDRNGKAIGKFAQT